ncbi:hypothetical protein ABFS83_04G172700 [Erythranthe nasuta]
MAYSAVNSLIQTTQRLLKSSRISIAPNSVKIAEFVYEEARSLQQVLKTLDRSSTNRNKVNDLDKQIRDTFCELEDTLEQTLFDDQDINSLSEMSKKMKDYTAELKNQLHEDDNAVSSNTYDINSSTEMLSKMMECTNSDVSTKLCEKDDALSSRTGNFGVLCDEFSKIKDLLTDQFYWEIKVVALFGMAGIGKTYFAKKIFEDPSISSRFDCRAFVNIGQKYELKEVIRAILAQLDRENGGMFIERDDKLVEVLYGSLKGRKYLVVLDDVWDPQVFDDLIGLFPDFNSGSRVLITTRLEEVAKSCLFWKDLREIFPNNLIGTVVSQTAKLKGEAQYGLYGFREMRLLSKEESWHLLRAKVFGEEYSSCSYKLEKAGKKIAEKCEGLPLTIVTVGKILLEAENKTWEYWNEVAEKQNSVFVDAYERMYEVLFRSYENLPQHLKVCFLYMGVFLEKHEIIRSKLIDLWIADGILESHFYGSEYLEKLVSSSVAMVLKQSYNGQTKTCSLHSTFWYLCNKEAAKSKFFYALNSVDDALEEEGIESQRRLCIRNNVLFGIKDVYDFVGSISTVRSLLCTGLYHQFPVPICFDLILLRVLDALTIRFYEFPVEVVKLVQLRYLALTSNGELHFSISNLSSLEYLIVHRHLDIVKSDNDSSYLPKEIWNMKALKYLHVMGSDIPNPCEKESLLPNLVTLLDASPQSCTKAVLERMPRLKKLGIRIELDEPFSFFDHISHLRELRSLKCVVANPLTMSGFGYSWEQMKTIGLLPNLEVLKLRCYAFRGVKWETCKDGFAKLKFLSIEDTDLVQWTVEHGSLPLLQFLSIQHCYKLKEIPQVILSTLRKIELVDCSSLVVRCAKGIKEELLEKRCDLLEISVLSSWDDVKV